MPIRIVRNRDFEKALEKARDELGSRLEAFTPVMDKIFIDFGIPMEYGTKNWESFVLGLDQLLQDNFSMDRDEEDK